MNSDERVKAVAEFGFTERQARFLVTLMLHSGLCVPRQYASFAGIAYGHKVTKFFDRLAQFGYASACGCLHNRAELDHVKHHAEGPVKGRQPAVRGEAKRLDQAEASRRVLEVMVGGSVYTARRQELCGRM